MSVRTLPKGSALFPLLDELDYKPNQNPILDELEHTTRRIRNSST